LAGKINQVLEAIFVTCEAIQAKCDTGKDRPILHLSQCSILVFGQEIEIILNAKRRYEQKKQYQKQPASKSIKKAHNLRLCMQLLIIVLALTSGECYIPFWRLRKFLRTLQDALKLGRRRVSAFLKPDFNLKNHIVEVKHEVYVFGPPFFHYFSFSAAFSRRILERLVGRPTKIEGCPKAIW
jgi:hypothetical protein